MIVQQDGHMTVDELIGLLGDELAEYETQMGHHLVVSRLGRLKEVADATTKFLLSNPQGQAKAVVICSHAVAPDLVMRGVEAAKAIRELVGTQLGEAIIQPLGSGYVAGRSYVVLPWYRDFSSWKPRRVVQRFGITAPLLRWLQQATAAAAASSGHSEEIARSFSTAIEHLSKQPFCTRELSLAVRASMDRLDSGKWSPRNSFDHNDLWLGNVLLRPPRLGENKTRYGFVVIDWAGANSSGYGIYDLLRLARSLKISDSTLRRQLMAHSKALQCSPEDTRGHLLACMGRLHQHMEWFPEDRYLSTFDACLRRLDRALPELGLRAANP